MITLFGPFFQSDIDNSMDLPEQPDFKHPCRKSPASDRPGGTHAIKTAAMHLNVNG